MPVNRGLNNMFRIISCESWAFTNPSKPMLYNRSETVRYLSSVGFSPIEINATIDLACTTWRKTVEFDRVYHRIESLSDQEYSALINLQPENISLFFVRTS